MNLISGILFVVIVFLSLPSYAWDGYDYETGSNIEIGKGNLVREGLDIEIYDYDSGEYRDVEVQSIDNYGGNVELEVYDYDSGEYRTFDMDR